MLKHNIAKEKFIRKTPGALHNRYILLYGIRVQTDCWIGNSRLRKLCDS